MAVSGVPEDLSPARVAELMREESAQVVDVREQYERDAGRIADTVHIELNDLPTQAGTLDRERTVVFYCRSGSRSAMAAQAFAAAGFEAHNLDGGLERWVADGLPIEPPDGRVA
jgi:rhodanese-related sulfurtransferase